MRVSKYASTWKEVWLKLASNIVSRKVWVIGIASVALFMRLIDGTIWAIMCCGLMGITEVMKPLIDNKQIEKTSQVVPS